MFTITYIIFANKRRRKALNKGKTKIAGGEKCKIKVKLK